MKLPDGSFIPSNLSLEPLPEAHSQFMVDFSFKQGTIVKVYYPSDPANLSQQFIEYDVLVAKRDMRSGANFLIYKNCQVSDKFGAVNNYEDFTLQAATSIKNGVPVGGSTVTVLCIDATAISARAIIVGGKKSRLYKPEESDGQFHEYQFNGINIKVNNDGEYTIIQNTPIDQSGNQADKAAAGTQLKIDKDGRFAISDNESQSITFDRVSKNVTWTNGNDSVVVDKANKKVILTSSGNVESTSSKDTNLTSNGDENLSAQGSINLSSGKDISAKASGNRQDKIGSNWQIQVGGNVNLQAGGNVQLQASGTAQLNGTINMIGTGAVPVAAVGVSQCIGIGNLGAPVVSTIITGSSTVLVGT